MEQRTWQGVMLISLEIFKKQMRWTSVQKDAAIVDLAWGKEVDGTDFV